MKRKRLLSLLMCAALALTLLPAVAFAATGSSMQLGTNGIEAGDKVYFGNYTESGTSYNVPWVVLNSGSLSETSIASGANALPLLSEYLLGASQFQSSGSGYYSGSTLQTAMNTVYSEFTTQEQGAVLETTLTGDSMYSGESDLEDQKLFPLSYDEANAMGSNTYRVATYITDQSGSAGLWWLRSSYNNFIAYHVDGVGNNDGVGVNIDYGVRPAFNLNLNSVLFASDAAGGKSSGTVGAGALTAVPATTPSAWKLTLEDSSRSFSASTTAIDTSANTVTIAYSGAMVGTNEYISAVILDSSFNIKYYGRIAQPSAATGTATIDISNLSAGDTLKVFSEQYNGDYKTDYASSLQTILNPVTYSLSNLTTSGAAYAGTASDYTATLTADTGYILPASISVTVGGTSAIPASSAAEADTAGEYYYDASTGSIKVAAVNGAVIITASGVAKTYTVSTSPSSLDFGSLTEGYTTAPAAQTVTITNNGNSAVTGYTVTGGGTDFNVAYTSAAIAASGTSTFTVQPVTGLSSGSHTATFTITTNEGSIATVSLSFTVTAKSSSGGGGSSTTYYTITAKAGTGGSISPSGSISVAYGNAKTYSITVDEGYEIEDVLVDGVSVGAVSAYTFENVNKTHTITVSFKKTVVKAVNPFTDLTANDWFYENVLYVYKNGLMTGTGSDAFSPNGTMTRAMLVTVLYRLSGDKESYTNTFSDVPSGTWYETAVAWAAKNGIASGVGGNRFTPESAVSREQLAVMLYNYAKFKGFDVSVGKDTNILSYNDAANISDYAYSALQWACGAGIMNGDGSGNLNPKSSATRAEVAAMLQRFITSAVTD